MKNRITMAAIICMIIGIAFFSYSHFIKKAEADTKTTTKEFVSQIDKSNIFPKIGKSLNDNGLTYGLEWNVLSNKEVEIQVKLPKKNISEETKKRIENIVNSVVKENNFDTNIFKINVTNYGNTSPLIIEQSKKK